jgi:hypothetical protein
MNKFKYYFIYQLQHSLYFHVREECDTTEITPLETMQCSTPKILLILKNIETYYITVVDRAGFLCGHWHNQNSVGGT